MTLQIQKVGHSEGHLAWSLYQVNVMPKKGKRGARFSVMNDLRDVTTKHNIDWILVGLSWVSYAFLEQLIEFEYGLDIR